MVRVSEEQKVKIRDSILESAKNHFLEKGYDDTKTKDIAADAGIAEGTLFNYFDTKTEIFLESMASGYIVNMNAKDELDYKNEIADIIYDLFYKTMKPLTKIPRRIIKEIFFASLAIAKKKPELIKRIAQLDYNLLEDLENIIAKLMQENRLKKGNAKMLSEIVYSAAVVEVTLYIYEDKITLEEMLENVKEKIKFILEGHIL